MLRKYRYTALYWRQNHVKNLAKKIGKPFRENHCRETAHTCFLLERCTWRKSKFMKWCALVFCICLACGWADWKLMTCQAFFWMFLWFFIWNLACQWRSFAFHAILCNPKGEASLYGLGECSLSAGIFMMLSLLFPSYSHRGFENFLMHASYCYIVCPLCISLVIVLKFCVCLC